MTHTTPDFHDQCRELTETRRHREPYTRHVRGTQWADAHVTTVPSLLSQLDNATQQAMNEGGSSGGFKSRPAAYLESIDTLIEIDLAAARWVRDLGEDDPGDTAACVRLLHGLHASASFCGHAKASRDEETKKVTCCSKHAIEVDVRRWWTQARIITGWDSPAWRPDSTCPLCGKRGTLRIRFAAHSGMCIDCRETWDEHNIGVLADHIRAENLEDDEHNIGALTQAAYAVPDQPGHADPAADA